MSVPTTAVPKILAILRNLRSLIAVNFMLSVLISACVEWPQASSPNISAPFTAQIAFSSDRKGSQDIYILDTESQDLVHVTDDKGEDIWPVWSPAGTHIAFYSDRDGDMDLYIVETTNNKLLNLSDDENDDLVRFNWSPDGSRIAFDSRSASGSYEILVSNLNDKTPISITEDGVRQSGPVWSPDGNNIAYAVENMGLVIADLRTGQITQLLEDEMWVSDLDWSPDGQWIVFETARPDGTVRIDVIDIDGSQRYESICGDLLAVNPVWSSTGEWIAFIGGPPGEGSTLYIVKKDGNHLTELVENGVMDSSSWSPDGKWIAFTGNSNRIDRRPGDLDIYAVAIDTGELVNLTPSKGNDERPAWRPQP
jgi:Tol biopolymer transport system component